jgi:DNA-binding transcriptional MocR family regulator
MNQAGFTKLPNSLWAPQAKLTYAAIASFAYGAKTTAWPSQTTLARQTGFSERSIRRSASELEAAGLLRIERRSGTSNVYELLVPAGHSGVESQTGHTVHTPRPESPYPPDPEAPKEDETNEDKETKKGNQGASSPDMGSGVRIEGRGGAEPEKLFDASDVESWNLAPDHLKVDVPGSSSSTPTASRGGAA